jgi:NADH-quinone oxidoreductase subunit N
VSFQLSDVSKLIPEFLLILGAVFVLIGDLFGRWRKGPEGYAEQANEAATMTIFILGFAFVVTLIQGGFLLHYLGEPSSWPGIGGLITNLRASGQPAEILGGAFVVDPLTHVGRLIFLGAAMVTVVLTRTQRPSTSPGEFYALILFSTLGMILMTSASEMIMIYLGIEMTSIPLYVLAGYYRRDRLSAESGIKYYIFGALSSAILLFGMSLLLGMTLMNPQSPDAVNTVPTSLRSVSLAVQTAFATPSNPAQAVIILALILLVAGMAYKVAVVPFHSWAPDVYQGAPTAITAFVSTASKTAGFFLLYRVLLSGFGAPQTTGTAALLTDAAGGVAFGGWSSMIAIIAALTMLVGNLAALPQTNAKRMLAYSSRAPPRVPPPGPGGTFVI